MTQPPSEFRWTNLALFRLGAFGFGITGFFMALDSIVLPILVLELAPEGAKNTFLGALGLSGLIVAALVQPLVGWYSDRTSTPLGRRVPFMLWGCTFVCLGLAGLGFLSNYLSLFVLWLFIQANASIGYGPFQAVIRDFVPIHRIGVASSLKILADGAGGVTLVAISGFLLGRYAGPASIHWLWVTLGVVAATLLVTVSISGLTILRRERAVGFAQGETIPRLRPVSGLHPQLVWFLISRYLIITAIFVFPTYGLFFLRDVVGVANPAQTLGLMILFIGGALVLSVYPAGWLSDKIGRKPVVTVGAVAAAVCTLAVLTADNATEVVVISSILGASVGGVLAANWALANELGTTGREGQHIGVVNLATIGGAASAKLMGPGVDLLNLAAPGLGYSALLVGCSIAFLLGALLLIPLNSQARQHPASEESHAESL